MVFVYYTPMRRPTIRFTLRVCTTETGTSSLLQRLICITHGPLAMAHVDYALRIHRSSIQPSRATGPASHDDRTSVSQLQVVTAATLYILYKAYVCIMCISHPCPCTLHSRPCIDVNTVHVRPVIIENSCQYYSRCRRLQECNWTDIVRLSLRQIILIH